MLEIIFIDTKKLNDSIKIYTRGMRKKSKIKNLLICLFVNLLVINKEIFALL